MWKRRAQGKALTFHLAGINNQNFIMRDEETGSYWQQVSGAAISGPMQGTKLELAPYDELSFALWKAEAPSGTVLAPVAAYAAEYETTDWEAHIGKLPSVVDVSSTHLAPREIVIGVAVNNSDRAYPLNKILAQSPIQDKVAGRPLLIVLGPDGKSVRVFASAIAGQPVEFFKKVGSAWSLTDASQGSEWNFQGCATSGPARGACLEPIASLKDYWFDWKNYHPATTLYSR